MTGWLTDTSLPWWAYLIATVVLIGSAGRLTRLVVSDHWPPVLWVKERWDAWTDRTERRKAWWLLLNCPWCLAPWFTGALLLWAWLSHLHWTWWVVNGWLTLSYVVSWLVFHDEDGAADDA